jgi:hypothetical protein
MHDSEDNSDWNRLRIFPVYEHISAGHFGPSGILLEPASYLETQQILLEDCIHRIYSLLRTERVLNLSSPERFYILKVSGNSMNQSQPVPIEDSDYVLMRQQSTANNGDIVAAEIISGDDRDSRATLKRLMNSNGKIILTPESNDPRYTKPVSPQSHFNKFDDGFRICGVAIAVFKKI